MAAETSTRTDPKEARQALFGELKTLQASRRNPGLMQFDFEANLEAQDSVVDKIVKSVVDEIISTPEERKGRTLVIAQAEFQAQLDESRIANYFSRHFMALVATEAINRLSKTTEV